MFIIAAPPVFTSVANKNFELISGNNITLDCSASSQPPSDIVWYKNDQLLSPFPNIIITEKGQKLLLQNISISDDGHYFCIAKNLVGESKNEFQLSISGKKLMFCIYLYVSAEFNFENIIFLFSF